MSIKWGIKEELLLESLSGSYVGQDLFNLYRRIAKKEGWPYRTDKAIANKIFRMGGTLRGNELDSFSCRKFSELLGIPFSRVHRWIKKQGLPARRTALHYIIRVKEFTEWAKHNVEWLHGMSVEVLKWVTGKTFKIPQSFEKSPKPVIRLSDGRRWPSISAAARESYHTYGQIKRAIAAGRGWAYVDN